MQEAGTNLINSLEEVKHAMKIVLINGNQLENISHDELNLIMALFRALNAYGDFVKSQSESMSNMSNNVEKLLGLLKERP